MATVCHVTSSSGLRKFQADGFLFDRVYKEFYQMSICKILEIPLQEAKIDTILNDMITSYLYRSLRRRVCQRTATCNA
jgi:hypothetical protein